jgi:hypothetical protein
LLLRLLHRHGDGRADRFGCPARFFSWRGVPFTGARYAKTWRAVAGI